MKPKQPVQRIGYFPEQPAAAKPHAESLRRRVNKPHSAYAPAVEEQPTQPPRSRAARAEQMADSYPQNRPFQEHAPVNGEAQHSHDYAARPVQPRRPVQSRERSAHAQQPRRSAPPRRPVQAARAPRQTQPISGGYQLKQESGKTPPKQSVWMQRLVMLVCVAVFAVSAFLLVRYFVNIAITRKASSQLEEVYSAALQNTEEPAPTLEPTATPTPTAVPTVMPKATPIKAAAPAPTVASASSLWPDRYPNNPSLRVSSVFYELQRENPDIIGWLKIDGVLEEAVVQRDNEYYLTHNALKQKSVTGALFLDESCDLKRVPTQMLIHGHNMKEGAMFGSLKKYKVKDASFYRQHPFIEFNTMYENGKYVIFAVAEVDLRWNKGDYLPFWQDVRFASADSFMEYVKKARNLSHYHCNVDVEPGDRLLTLSTCTGNDDNKRLIVMARKLRDHENELELNMSIMTTYDR